MQFDLLNREHLGLSDLKIGSGVKFRRLVLQYHKIDLLKAVVLAFALPVDTVLRP